jgi:hypothetical protein
MIRRVLHTTVGATVLSAALAMSWTAVTVTVAVVLVFTIALCWVVADADRPSRLALLLTAWRHGTPVRPRHTRKPRPPAADRTPAAKQAGQPTPDHCPSATRVRSVPDRRVSEGKQRGSAAPTRLTRWSQSSQASPQVEY